MDGDMPLSAFPIELLTLTFDYLPLSDLPSIALTCKAHFEICKRRLPDYVRARDQLRHVSTFRKRRGDLNSSLMAVLKVLADDPARCRWIETCNILQSSDWGPGAHEVSEADIHTILNPLQSYIASQSAVLAQTRLVHLTITDVLNDDDRELSLMRLMVHLLLCLLPNVKAFTPPLGGRDNPLWLPTVPSLPARNGVRDDILTILVEEANTCRRYGKTASLANLSCLKFASANKDTELFMTLNGITRLECVQTVDAAITPPCYKNIVSASFCCDELVDNGFGTFLANAPGLRELHVWGYTISSDHSTQLAYSAHSIVGLLSELCSETIESLKLDCNSTWFNTYHDIDSGQPLCAALPTQTYRKLKKLRHLTVHIDTLTAHSSVATECGSGSAFVLEELFPSSLASLRVMGTGGGDHTAFLQTFFPRFYDHGLALPALRTIEVIVDLEDLEDVPYISCCSELQQDMQKLGIEFHFR